MKEKIAIVSIVMLAVGIIGTIIYKWRAKRGA